MKYEILYSKGKRKALTFSYDDGQIYDRRLVELFNRYQLKGTFHLNSGKIDQEGFISSGELKELYAEHEISCHGVEHHYLRHLTREGIVTEIWEDRKKLEEWSGGFVLGMSYAFGEYDDRVIEVLKCLGIQYSRTVESTGQFAVPEDFLRWKPTCHHKDHLMERANAFLNPHAHLKLPLFYIWGHSYEFERDHNWELIEAFCEQIAFQEDIWYTTNIDYKNYMTAARNLIFHTGNACVYNPSGVSVWFDINGEIREVKPGEQLSLT